MVSTDDDGVARPLELVEVETSGAGVLLCALRPGDRLTMPGSRVLRRSRREDATALTDEFARTASSDRKLRDQPTRRL